MACSPRRQMNRHAISRDIVVSVALFVQRCDRHAEIEKVSYAIHVPHARELSQGPSTIGTELPHDVRLVRGNRRDRLLVISRTSCQKHVESVKLDG